MSRIGKIPSKTKAGHYRGLSDSASYPDKRYVVVEGLPRTNTIVTPGKRIQVVVDVDKKIAPTSKVQVVTSHKKPKGVLGRIYGVESSQKKKPLVVTIKNPSEPLFPHLKGATVTIDPLQAAKLYIGSSDFRNLMDSGNFVHTGDRIALNHPAAVRMSHDDGNLHLSGRANKNPGRYCVQMKKSSDGILSFQIPEKYDELVNAGVDIDAFLDTADELLDYPKEKTIKKASVMAVKTDVMKPDKINKQNPILPIGWKKPMVNELEDVINKYKKKTGLSNKDIEKALNLGDNSASRLWTNREKRVSLDILVALCLLLHMPLKDSMRVLTLCGYCLRDIPVERTYGFLLNMCYMLDLSICNMVLKATGHRAIPFNRKRKDDEV